MVPAARERLALRVAAGAVPAALAFWVSYTYLWNHFYGLGPFLQDSGSNSGILFRRGLIPFIRPIEDPAGSYFDIHVSPLISVLSVASYLFPGDRIDWYCVVQTALFVPLALVLLPLRSALPSRARMAWAIAGGVTFVLNGQVLNCLGYPHHEIVIPAAICLMLAFLATNRKGPAVFAAILAVSAREDGGIHAALFLSAMALSNRTNRSFPISAQWLFRAACMCLLASGLAFAAQALFFSSANLFRREYLGEPLYGHLSVNVLAERLRTFAIGCLFITLPFGVSVAVAVWRRDVRYLLGWFVEAPWFALNLLACQTLKSRFEIYTGFPFVASIFWLVVYGLISDRGTKIQRPTRASAALGVFCAANIASFAGLWLSQPGPFRHIVGNSVSRLNADADAERRLFQGLRKNSEAFGRLIVDDAVASWATESLMPNQLARNHPDRSARLKDADSYIFFITGLERPALLVDLAWAPHMASCAVLPGTNVWWCGRGAPPGEFLTASLSLALLTMRPDVTRSLRAIEVAADDGESRVAVYGPFVQLPVGDYVASFQLAPPAPCGYPRTARVDVARDARAISQEVVGNDTRVALPFRVAPDDLKARYEFRVWTDRCTHGLLELRLVALPENLAGHEHSGSARDARRAGP